jgi:hypothetical protein
MRAAFSAHEAPSLDQARRRAFSMTTPSKIIPFRAPAREEAAGRRA